MNESTLIQLKILVERAVRPVRASVVRKQTMREELLAHVTAVYEEEFLRLADDVAARTRTALRFGNPADVTQNLQASLPRVDVLDRFVDELWHRPGESTWRRAVRHSLLAEVWLVPIVALVVFAVSTQWGDGGNWPMASVLKFSAWAIGACAFLVIGGTFLAEQIRLQFNRRGNFSLSMALLLLASGPVLIDVMTGAGIALDVLDNFWLRPSKVAFLFVFGLIISAALASIALANNRRVLQEQEWASLSIGG